MNIRYLEIIEAIEQTGTFTGAAHKLHLTQSAVSHAVAELEAQAGTILFDRLPRGVRLTHCGEVLLEEGRSILAACRDLDRRISSLEEYAPVNIVSSITIATLLLPPILSRLKETFPALQVNVNVVSATSAMDILKDGKADIAFWEGVEPQGAFRTILLGSYKLCAACAPTFSIEEQVIEPRQLCGLPLLLREQGSAIRDALDSALALAGQKVRPAWESVNSFALVKAAEAGLGVTVLPENLLADSLSQRRLRPIRVKGIKMENKMFAILYKDKHITKPMSILLEAIIKIF